MPRIAALLIAVASLSASAAEVIGIKGTSIQPFVGVSGGIGAVTSRHPAFNSLFAAPGFALNVGVQFRKMWIFSAEVGSISKFVARNPDGSGTFQAASGAECTTCNAESGGLFYSGTAVFPTAGPRVDFSPFGETSPFVSVSGGFVFTQGALGYMTGEYVTGRIGFRYRFVPRIEASAEGGYQAEWFPISTLRNAFGNLMIRAYF